MHLQSQFLCLTNKIQVSISEALLIDHPLFAHFHWSTKPVSITSSMESRCCPNDCSCCSAHPGSTTKPARPLTRPATLECSCRSDIQNKFKTMINPRLSREIIFSIPVPFWYSSMAERPPEYPPHPFLQLFVLSPLSHTQDPPQHRPSSLSGLPMQPPENWNFFNCESFFQLKNNKLAWISSSNTTPLSKCFGRSWWVPWVEVPLPRRSW